MRRGADEDVSYVVRERRKQILGEAEAVKELTNWSSRAVKRLERMNEQGLLHYYLYCLVTGCYPIYRQCACMGRQQYCWRHKLEMVDPALEARKNRKRQPADTKHKLALRDVQKSQHPFQVAIDILERWSTLELFAKNCHIKPKQIRRSHKWCDQQRLLEAKASRRKKTTKSPKKKKKKKDELPVRPSKDGKAEMDDSDDDDDKLINMDTRDHSWMDAPLDEFEKKVKEGYSGERVPVPTSSQTFIDLAAANMQLDAEFKAAVIGNASSFTRLPKSGFRVSCLVPFGRSVALTVGGREGAGCEPRRSILPSRRSTPSRLRRASGTTTSSTTALSCS